MSAQGLGKRAAIRSGMAQIGQSRGSAPLGELLPVRFDQQKVVMVRTCTKLQQAAKQHMNKLMFRRILFQGAAIVVVAIILFSARK